MLRPKQDITINRSFPPRTMEHVEDGVERRVGALNMASALLPPQKLGLPVQDQVEIPVQMAEGFKTPQSAENLLAVNSCWGEGGGSFSSRVAAGMLPMDI